MRALTCRHLVSIYGNQKISEVFQNLTPDFFPRAGPGRRRHKLGEYRLDPYGRPGTSGVRGGNGGWLQARTVAPQDGPLADYSCGTGG